MKKILISCAVALLSLTALNANAADNSRNPQGEGQKTECVGKSCDKGDFKKGKKCKKGKKGGKDCCKGMKGQGQCCKGGKKGNPAFAGIDLTAEQQQKIDAINAKRKAAVEKSREEMQKAIAKDREAYNSEIRKVLTAEQQLTYDKNLAEMKARKAEKAAVRDAKRDYQTAKKEFKAGKKGMDKLGREGAREVKREAKKVESKL